MRLLALSGLAVLFSIPTAGADEPPAVSSTASAERPKSEGQGTRPKRATAERYANIRAEFEAERAAHNAELAASRRAATKAEKPPAKAPFLDRAADYARRMVDLAESSPQPHDQAARDALLWVIEPKGRPETGAYGDQFARAAALLVRHYGDDPEAIRIGLELDNYATPRRDALLLGFYAAAKGREAKGLARLVLAEYLARKAQFVVGARKVEGRPKRRMIDRAKGSIREFDRTDEEYADHLALRQCDPQAIQAEAERLFEEVISEYGDVPHVTWRMRKLEALLKDPKPQWNGKPLTAEDRRAIEERLAWDKKTLGEEAEAQLDDMHNLVVGKPAPEIEGVDVDGKPLKLSDYRGKVVVLVFWGSWCGPCMAEIPHERELVERLKGQPFALLGVDCEDNKGTAREVMARERMNWPNWFDGPVGSGPIAKRYDVRGFPRIFILDARGIIRNRNAGSAVVLRDAVDKLLAEMKRPTSD